MRGAPEKNSKICDTFLGSIRVKLDQIRNFSILNNFPKWPTHFTVFFFPPFLAFLNFSRLNRINSVNFQGI